ncbi:S-protein homolog 2 [Physcomitrium patens]|uniref:S-protein homolog n=2 Tax=Physcomitrium patens TaxID=3218 RepID=A9TA27_PHYPA|nr:S-protein homolog 2-like [Physcomitrium patens]|eukprot:XP_024359984.1 S-protein homolog 2-like [Physcomitrella patens]
MYLNPAGHGIRTSKQAATSVLSIMNWGVGMVPFRGIRAAVVVAVAVVLMASSDPRSLCVADEVIIVNDMNIVLELQCRSGDEVDLGYRTIEPGLSWTFSFSPNWWSTTVYACDFHAVGFPLKHTNVYEGINVHDNFCLCGNCLWRVSRVGFDCERGQYTTKWK